MGADPIYEEDRNQECLDFMIEYIRVHGYPPSLSEVADAMGYMENYSATRRIRKLIEAGMIETDHPGKGRCYRIPGYKFVKVES